MTIATARNCSISHGLPCCYDCKWWLPPKFSEPKAPKGYCSRSAPKFDGAPVLVVVENYAIYDGQSCFGFKKRW
jgi:hypothetical protein